MGKIIWFLIVAVIAFWIIGFALKLGGGLIHFLLILAGILFIIQLISGKRAV